ncbi:MAG: 3-deoxy-D-manno-octulosonic acid transferase [Alphaproteobacteria bacterium]|nr:3-deoxy-D-manno-octulosonic acid transferase [Alphaproteobacteria bacterium]
MLSILYRVLTDLGAPFIRLYLWRRLAIGREDAARFTERLGQPGRERPEGRLVWCHAASVGESVSLLFLIEKMHDTYPDLSFLVTTGTVTAARLMQTRLPPYAFHQYVPVDRAAYAKRFLDYWDPALVLWVESELWPNLLAGLRERDIPAILLNARMSEKSFRNWRRVKGWVQEILSTFVLCLPQTEEDRSRLVALGAKPVKYLGNLKYAAMPLPHDEAALQKLRDEIGARPLWVMASTHRGEEDMAVTAHKGLAATRPDILTVIVPRHASRGDEITALLTNAGLRVARRSKTEAIAPETQVYLADTMGELGLFYRLCPIVVMGGSFVRIGGHNPIEPAQLGAAILVGPFMFNFTEIAREFLAEGAALQLQHANEIAFAVERLIAQPNDAAKLSQSAHMIADQKRHILDQIIVEMEPWLRQ